jgi:hypothetical protein
VVTDGGNDSQGTVGDDRPGAIGPDQELLANEREHHGDPYMTLAKAKKMQRVALQFWHPGGTQEERGPGGPAGLERDLGVKHLESAFSP